MDYKCSMWNINRANASQNISLLEKLKGSKDKMRKLGEMFKKEI